MSIRIKADSKEWGIAKFISGAIDIIQLILDFIPGVGEGVNMIADVIIGIILAIYFLWRGFSIIQHTKLYISLLAILLGQEATVGVASVWIGDIFYAQSIARKEEAAMQAYQAEQEFLQMNMDRPANENGVRMPTGQKPERSIRPANMSGVRAPGGARGEETSFAA